MAVDATKGEVSRSKQGESTATQQTSQLAGKVYEGGVIQQRTRRDYLSHADEAVEGSVWDRCITVLPPVSYQNIIPSAVLRYSQGS